MSAHPAPSEKPYGFVVRYEYRESKGGMFDSEIKTGSFRRKGSEQAARRAAVMKRGYLRVLPVDPYTYEQWLRCFGEGRM